jgi:ribosomal protein S18 acetylase RimI-like enzyme
MIRSGEGVTVLVRRASAGDVGPISVLAQAIQAFHAATLPHLFKPAGPEVFPPSAARASLQHPDHFLHVAEDDGQIVGYIQAEVQREAETTLKYGRELVYIRQMGIASTHQRRGIGRLLLDVVRRDADSRGITTITLTVYTANLGAREFYSQYGFSPYREDWHLG